MSSVTGTSSTPPESAAQAAAAAAAAAQSALQEAGQSLISGVTGDTTLDTSTIVSALVTSKVAAQSAALQDKSATDTTEISSYGQLRRPYRSFRSVLLRSSTDSCRRPSLRLPAATA